MSGPLVCPRCASTHALEERFCPECGMPLVYAGTTGVDQPVTEAHERARKIKKQYAEGKLVWVASARSQAEGELIQGLLLEEGVPSLMRRSGGFDVPDFLAAGPRDVLVPASGAEVAREILAPVGSGERPSWIGPEGGSQVKVSFRATAFVLAVVLAVAGLAPLVAYLATR